MKTIRPLLKHFRFAFVICLAAVVVVLATGRRTWAGPMLIAMFGSLALYFMSHS